MAYTSQTFEDGNVLYASELNAMDAGILEVQAANAQNAAAISQNTEKNAVQYDPDNPPPYPVTSVNGQTGAVVLDAEDVSALPASTEIPTALAELTADATHRTVTDTQIETWNGKSDFSGSYNDLTDKPTIPTVPVRSVNGQTGAVVLDAEDVNALPASTEIPTALSELTADATHRTVTDTQIATWNGKSDFSGSYNDLTDKPTIPTVPVQSVNGQTGAVVLDAEDVGAVPTSRTINGNSLATDVALNYSDVGLALEEWTFTLEDGTTTTKNVAVKGKSSPEL